MPFPAQKVQKRQMEITARVNSGRDRDNLQPPLKKKIRANSDFDRDAPQPLMKMRRTHCYSVGQPAARSITVRTEVVSRDGCR